MLVAQPDRESQSQKCLLQSIHSGAYRAYIKDFTMCCFASFLCRLRFHTNESLSIVPYIKKVNTQLKAFNMPPPSGDTCCPPTEKFTPAYTVGMIGAMALIVTLTVADVEETNENGKKEYSVDPAVTAVFWICIVVMISSCIWCCSISSNNNSIRNLNNKHSFNSKFILTPHFSDRLVRQDTIPITLLLNLLQFLPPTISSLSRIRFSLL